MLLPVGVIELSADPGEDPAEGVLVPPVAGSWPTGAAGLFIDEAPLLVSCVTTRLKDPVLVFEIEGPVATMMPLDKVVALPSEPTLVEIGPVGEGLSSPVESVLPPAVKEAPVLPVAEEIPLVEPGTDAPPLLGPASGVLLAVFPPVERLDCPDEP